MDSQQQFSRWCPGFDGSPPADSVTLFDLKNDCWKTSTETEHPFICERMKCLINELEVSRVAAGARHFSAFEAVARYTR